VMIMIYAKKCEAVNLQQNLHNAEHVFLKIYKPITNDKVVLCRSEQRIERVEKQLEEVKKLLEKEDKQKNQSKQISYPNNPISFDSQFVQKLNVYNQKQLRKKLRKQLKKEKKKEEKKLQKQNEKNSESNCFQYQNYATFRFEPKVKDEQIIPQDEQIIPQVTHDVSEEKQIPLLDKKVEVTSRDQETSQQPLVEPQTDDQEESPQTDDQEESPQTVEEKLAALSAMGFVDRKLNIELLKTYDSDINQVVQELLYFCM